MSSQPLQQPIYLDAEEEIPDLIERLRSARQEEVPVVVPLRSRVGQSRFNFQILRDYARSLGKRIAVVSAEASVRQMAEEAGFAAFTDLDEFRWAADRAPVAAVSGRPLGYATPPAQPVLAPVRAPEVPPARTPKMVVTTPSRQPTAGVSRTGPGRFLLYLGAGLILVVGLVSAAVFVPSATVTLTAKAQPLKSESSFDAAPNSAPVHVRQVTASKNASNQFPATGDKVTSAQYATGVVMLSAKPCFPYSGYDIGPPVGTRISTPQGVRFAITDTKVHVDCGGPSVPANVIAESPGAAGNVASNQITVLPSNYSGTTLSATNPNPTSGGVDEKHDKFVSQSDLDAAKATLTGQLKANLIDALSAQAAQNEKLADTTDCSKVDFQSDHKLNDFVSQFTATVTETCLGAVYNVDDVKKQLQSDLGKKVPSGYTLTDNSITTTYSVTQSTADGHISFAGTANGFIAPKIDYEKIRGRLIGSSTASARLYLATLPVESVQIKQHPATLPVLPVLGSRIDIRYQVDAQSGPTATQ